MKLKIWILGSIGLFLFSCASMEVKKQKSNYFEDYSFEEVWKASQKALKDVAYVVKESDREGGRIFAQAHPNPRRPFQEQEQPPNITIIISEENGRIRLACKVVVVTAFGDAMEKRKAEMSIFLDALHKNLEK